MYDELSHILQNDLIHLSENDFARAEREYKQFYGHNGTHKRKSFRRDRKSYNRFYDKDNHDEVIK